MERFIIGRCRTGKIITSHPDLDYLATAEEIFDAMAVLSLLAVRERRRDKTGDLAHQLSIESNNLVRLLRAAKQWDAQMQKVGAKTIFDVQRYAENLLRSEFKV
jgi:hypothetical protein